MRTSKKELVSDNLKPFIGKLIKENRLKYNYSLEDLAKAINYQKNRQTLHKYETGLLNIPYDLFFEICRIFNIDTSIFANVDITEEEKHKLESKFVKEYVSSTRIDENLNVTGNGCNRGIEYGINELTNPTRMVTSTVVVLGGELSRCSVATSKPIPKNKIFDVMNEINKVKVNAPIYVKDIIIKDVLNLGVDIIATRDIKEK